MPGPSNGSHRTTSRAVSAPEDKSSASRDVWICVDSVDNWWGEVKVFLVEGKCETECARPIFNDLQATVGGAGSGGLGPRGQTGPAQGVLRRDRATADDFRHRFPPPTI